MHKILFFVYGIFYSKFNIELWNPDFHSWKLGPVEIKYKNYFENKTLENFNHFNINFDLTNEHKLFLFKTLENLFKISTWDLVEYSHKFDSYKNGKLNNPQKINNNEIYKDFKNFKIKNRNYDIRNILGFQKTNNEFYTPIEPILELIKILKIPKQKVIWCPFDKDDSNFVLLLKEHGYKVINSHIDYGQDFFNYQPNEKFDVIISNPPFTNKRLLIERCQSFNKDFCLLYGTTIFSQSMGNTLNTCKFWFIQRNIKFTTTEPNKYKSFQCCWVMNKEFKYLKD